MSLHRLEVSISAHQPSEAHGSLRWFTNTTLYRAWLSESRGEIVCPRFIWYATKEHPHFGSLFAAARRAEGVQVLYIDCSLRYPDHVLDGEHTLEAQQGIWRYPLIRSSKAAFILWCLIGQALQGRCQSAGEVGACISKILKQYPGTFVDIQEGGKTTLEPFEKLLQSALNIDPNEEATIILDHVDAIDGMTLKPLRESVQKVLDGQREDDVAKVRCLITGKPTPDVSSSFQGTASIDEDTEYLGELLVI